MKNTTSQLHNFTTSQLHNFTTSQLPVNEDFIHQDYCK